MVKDNLLSFRVTLVRSPRLFLFLLVSHTASVILLLVLPLSFGLRLLILFFIIASLVRSLRIHVFFSARSAIKSAELSARGEWRLFTTGGDELAAQLMASSYVHPWCTILNFSVNRFGRRSLVLLPDAVDPELLRRLRVRLRLLGGKEIA